MAKARDLTGQKFGHLMAMFATDKRVQGRVVWHCQCECGNEIDVPSHSLVSGNTKSCGCLKTEVTPKPKGNELIPVYAEWQKAVFEKDHHTCQRCGYGDLSDSKVVAQLVVTHEIKSLVAHHMDAYDNYPRSRTRLDNGVTLCKDCDDDFHHEYGHKNNTRRQFERWLRQYHKEG